MSAAGFYAGFDRALHRLAFAATGLQKVVADIEDQVLGAGLGRVAIHRPVFITSLPRAGTTLLLELLAPQPEFACHTYRNMPFLLTPLIWARFSAAFRRDGEMRERAHGDGVQVGFDSPEAFEEIIWKAFFREKYLPDRIRPWGPSEATSEFETFYLNHIRKILYLSRDTDGGKPKRYICKNNGNIARLATLTRLLPDARLVVPFRAPAAHVRSLMGQHARFTALHAEDPFTREYMEGLGHFEFGASLRPIDFHGWIDRAGTLSPDEPAFWVTYWKQAFRAILETAGEMAIFIDYDDTCARPAAVFSALGERLEIDIAPRLGAVSSHIRAPGRGRGATMPDGGRDGEADDIYAELRAKSLNGHCPG